MLGLREDGYLDEESPLFNAIRHYEFASSFEFSLTLIFCLHVNRVVQMISYHRKPKPSFQLDDYFDEDFRQQIFSFTMTILAQYKSNSNVSSYKIKR